MLSNMNVGGTEKALLNLLNIIPESEYDVTVLLLEKTGGFMNQIPSWVKLEELVGWSENKELVLDPPFNLAKKYFKQKNFSTCFNILFLHLFSKITGNRERYYKYVLPNFGKCSSFYDIAVAYAGPMDFITQYILDVVSADRKIQWIHFDVSKFCFNTNYAKNVYPRFDKIYAVSDCAKDKLLELIPEVETITETMHNVVSKNLCVEQALNENGFSDEFNGTRILTVGRLSKEKGQDIIPFVVEKLVLEGYKFKWYLIGDGALYTPIENIIKEKNLGDYLTLLGTKTNPYPYYKDCDLYVQTSHHEGYCITIAEALVFDKYVITTDVAGAHDQIKNKSQGVICACDAQSIFNEVKRFLSEN